MDITVDFDSTELGSIPSAPVSGYGLSRLAKKPRVIKKGGSMSFMGYEASGIMEVALDEGAFEPVRAHRGDAGLDIRTPIDFTIRAHDSAEIDTGIHVEIPLGWVGELESKSGLNVKYSIVSCGGTIDYGYTGSIRVKLFNFGDEDHVFERGDKIVQLVIHPCWLPSIKVVDMVHGSDRGDNGFGSSGR